MESADEVKGKLKLLCKKYADTQTNYFLLLNSVDYYEEEEDVEAIKDIRRIVEDTSAVNEKASYLFSQSNYIDFYNTLLDDEDEELRFYVMSEESTVQQLTAKMIRDAVLAELNAIIEDLEDDDTGAADFDDSAGLYEHFGMVSLSDVGGRPVKSYTANPKKIKIHGKDRNFSRKDGKYRDLLDKKIEHDDKIAGGKL